MINCNDDNDELTNISTSNIFVVGVIVGNAIIIIIIVVVIVIIKHCCYCC